MESKWQAYDDHVHKAREEEEKQRVRAKEEKERKKKRREKLMKLMQAKKEGNIRKCILHVARPCGMSYVGLERRKKLHEQTFHHAEELKKQADQHEKDWRERKEHEVVAWREKIHREQDHWQHHLHHQMDVCKNEHKQQMDDLLHKSYLPKCAKSPKQIGSSMSNKCSTDAAQPGKTSKDTTLKTRKKGVHFQPTASIHIFEEDDTDFEGEVEPINSKDNTNAAGGSAVDETTNRDELKVETDSSQTAAVSGEGALDL